MAQDFRCPSGEKVSHCDFDEFQGFFACLRRLVGDYEGERKKVTYLWLKYQFSRVSQ